ncbi:MAG: glycoside hydrolase family 38 C-terminal domain-containing protein [Phycisphaeraceae bacterium]
MSTLNHTVHAYDPALHARHASRLLNDVLRPAIFTDHVPLDVAVHQCDDPIPHADALTRDYTPVDVGFAWGPFWSTAWFRLRGEVPAGFKDDPWRVLFDTNTEALAWWNGAPYQGLEDNRQDVKLPDAVKPGDKLELYIEAACNGLFGLGNYAKPDREGKLKQAHVARHHPDRAAAAVELELVIDLAKALDAETPRGRQVAEGLRRACNAFDPADLDGSLPCVRDALRAVLDSPGDAERNTAHCVGHAHIDLAWLWPIRETRRKCARSFSTVLRYMERHPEYRFVQSQAQAYEWVRENYPDLFEQIRQRIKTGQWEAGGAMWVEADCNVTSGESLIRQIVKGTHYWRQHFHVEQRYLWLPDVFGYAAALPQILKLAGLDVFFTQKISWNQFNKFPHHTFNWVGIDGTAIPAHFFPADTYNATNLPKELLHGDRNFKQAGKSNHWLQVYGIGDGGGGPTEPMIERPKRLQDTAGLPKTRFTRVDEFVDVILQDADNLPEWVGELYLELHRGTLTTQARNKRFNRLGERLLQDVELLQCLAGDSDDERRELDRLWKLLLLNQFHDIIPGSSINWVYQDALRDYDDILTTGRKLLDAVAARAAGKLAGDSDTLIVNTTSRPVAGVVELSPRFQGNAVQVGGGPASPTQRTRTLDGEDKTLARLADVPPLSASPAAAVDQGSLGELKVEGLTLENAHVRVVLDDAGRVTSLLDKATGREAIRAGEPANQFVLYDDRPMFWDAWDVDVYYLERGTPIVAPAEHAVVEQGPVRGAIEFRRKLGKQSTLVQRVQLAAEARMVEFDTKVDWHEENLFLRVLHPVDVHSDQATYEIQFGHVRRPTHFNTSWDVARFEVAAQRWMDLSEAGYGVGLVNDCKYGHSCHRHVMGLSLLRSPKAPDPEADMAEHRFKYALLPHGPFDAAELTAAAEQVNQPLRALPAKAGGGSVKALSVAALEGPYAEAVVVDTVKLPEAGGGDVVLRLYEARGGRGEVALRLAEPAKRVVETDLHEQGETAVELAEAGRVVRVCMRPFQIRTLRISR